MVQVGGYHSIGRKEGEREQKRSERRKVGGEKVGEMKVGDMEVGEKEVDGQQGVRKVDEEGEKLAYVDTEEEMDWMDKRKAGGKKVG
jgi:hypothetical protein